MSGICRVGTAPPNAVKCYATDTCGEFKTPANEMPFPASPCPAQARISDSFAITDLPDFDCLIEFYGFVFPVRAAFRTLRVVKEILRDPDHS